MSGPGTGPVDLESVLNVRRRTLASIGESAKPRDDHHYRYTDTIYVKREDSTNSILSINSKVLIFGELQLLCSLFERYTANIVIKEEVPLTGGALTPPASTKPSFSTTAEENEDDTEGLPIVSTVRKVSISSGSCSPPKSPETSVNSRPGSERRTWTRSQSITGTASDYSLHNLEGKRYGNIELPTMTILEILEILFRYGLELVNVSSDYDHQKVLHQNFIFSKSQQTSQKGLQYYQRTASFTGT